MIALEEDTVLAATAKATLAGLGAGNVTVVIGAIAAGWPSKAPYDVILLEGATEIAPRALCGQLKDGGRLVCVQGRAPVGKAMIYRSVGGEISSWPLFDAAAPLLPGFAQPPTFVF